MELVLKALYPTPFGIRDPLFDRDVAFYVFQLPLWSSLYSWLMTVLILSGLAVIAVYFSARGIQISPEASRSPHGPAVISWAWPRWCFS